MEGETIIPVQLEANGPITQMDAAQLEKREGSTENERELTEWIEYRLKGRVVHRSVHVHLKQGLDSSIIQGVFGG